MLRDLEINFKNFSLAEKILLCLIGILVFSILGFSLLIIVSV